MEIHYTNKYSILYGIKCEDGEIYYFEGGNPEECVGHEVMIPYAGNEEVNYFQYSVDLMAQLIEEKVPHILNLIKRS